MNPRFLTTSFGTNPTATFARAWAKAVLAERDGQWLTAAEWYVVAAAHADISVEVELALTSAWIASERAQGRVSQLEVGDVPPAKRRRADGHLGASERDDTDERGYGHGV